mmetsp:Transcript_59084/g.117423  ORF Transcript_59084/g.117423 Transcript_59084/m.117423 type:complete len:281 (-) Transcript_59084:49-891(-)
MRGLNKRDLRTLLGDADEAVHESVLRSRLSFADLVETTDLDLCCRLDLPLADVRRLAAGAAKKLRPRITNAYQLIDTHEAGRPHASFIPTGFSPLDHHLGGGLLAGAVTELVGPAGAGKSQFCLAAAARVVLSGHHVVYLDTERGFSPSRLREVLSACSALAAPEVDHLLDTHFIVFRPKTWAEYAHCMAHALEEVLKPRETPQGKLKPAATLLVVDSIARRRTSNEPVHLCLALQWPANPCAGSIPLPQAAPLQWRCAHLSTRRLGSVTPALVSCHALC